MPGMPEGDSSNTIETKREEAVDFTSYVDMLADRLEFSQDPFGGDYSLELKPEKFLATIGLKDDAKPLDVKLKSPAGTIRLHSDDSLMNRHINVTQNLELHALTLAKMKYAEKNLPEHPAMIGFFEPLLKLKLKSEVKDMIKTGHTPAEQHAKSRKALKAVMITSAFVLAACGAKMGSIDIPTPIPPTQGAGEVQPIGEVVPLQRSEIEKAMESWKTFKTSHNTVTVSDLSYLTTNPEDPNEENMVFYNPTNADGTVNTDIRITFANGKVTTDDGRTLPGAFVIEQNKLTGAIEVSFAQLRGVALGGATGIEFELGIKESDGIVRSAPYELIYIEGFGFSETRPGYDVAWVLGNAGADNPNFDEGQVFEAVFKTVADQKNPISMTATPENPLEGAPEGATGKDSEGNWIKTTAEGEFTWNAEQNGFFQSHIIAGETTQKGEVPFIEAGTNIKNGIYFSFNVEDTVESVPYLSHMHKILSEDAGKSVGAAIYNALYDIRFKSSMTRAQMIEAFNNSQLSVHFVTPDGKDHTWNPGASPDKGGYEFYAISWEEADPATHPEFIEIAGKSQFEDISYRVSIDTRPDGTVVVRSAVKDPANLTETELMEWFLNPLGLIIENETLPTSEVLSKGWPFGSYPSDYVAGALKRPSVPFFEIKKTP